MRISGYRDVGMINMTFSAHLANVIANWAEMEFAALRLITFVTLAGCHHSLSISQSSLLAASLF